METSIVDRILGAPVDYITLAIPLFLVLIAIEFAFAWFARLEVYRLNDSINDLSCGILDQGMKLFLHFLLVALYVWVYENHRLFTIAEWSAWGKVGAAVVLFLGVDFCFYWHHRWSHEFAVPWATHVVHHQSEEFNLVVALRQSAFEHYLMSFAYVPLAWLGFPPIWFVAMFSFNLIWQFWCHTRLVDKLGPLEWVFNTPSHHRVHHGRNLKYLDKNYAGTLIIWDRLFGTFQPEEEEVVYGITKPLRSWNPIWANTHHWVELARDAYAAPYWWDKIRIWFMPLGWTPRGLPDKPRAEDVTPDSITKYDARGPLKLNLYVLFQFILVVIAANWIFAVGEHRPAAELAVPFVLVVLSLVTLGAMFEAKPWVPMVEVTRLVLSATLLVAYVPAESRPLALTAGIVVGIFLMVSFAWLWWCRDFFISPTHPTDPSGPAASELASTGPVDKVWQHS